MIELEAILGTVGVPMTGEEGASSLLESFREPLNSNISSPNRDEVSRVVSSLGTVMGLRTELTAGGLRAVPALEPPVPEL